MSHDVLLLLWLIWNSIVCVDLISVELANLLNVLVEGKKNLVFDTFIILCLQLHDKQEKKSFHRKSIYLPDYILRDSITKHFICSISRLIQSQPRKRKAPCKYICT